MRMKRLMAYQFLVLDYQKELFKQYQDCRQGTKIVNEYMEEFDRLVNHSDLEVLSQKKEKEKKSDLEDTKDQWIFKFVYGLQMSI